MKLFITGSGTDIGKTFITTRLAEHLRARGRLVRALKPLASGCHDEDSNSDPARLLAACGQTVTPAALDSIAPWRFEAPLAPHLAARKVGRDIGFGALVDFCQTQMAQAEGDLLIEAVGGIMAPVTARQTCRDWASALDLPCLLVTGSYLGAVSHALTALLTLRQAGLTVSAIVLNETAGSSVDLADTRDMIAAHSGPTPVLVCPQQAPCDHSVFTEIVARVDGMVDLNQSRAL